jgi:Flp pilus assembly protein TadD
LLAEALVASGWNDAKVYRWNTTSRKAREALSFVDPGSSSRGAHALLGEALYAQRDFGGALGEFTKALAETPRDARLKRRVVRSRRQLHHPVANPGDAESTPPEATPEQ